VLAFDIDAKDLAADRLTDDHDTRARKRVLDESGIASEPPVQPARDAEPYYYSFGDITRAIHLGFDLKQFLQDELQFEHVRVFYSGQGVHVYALDDDKWHRYTSQSRTFLTTYLEDKIGLPIDAQVTTESQRVLRIPRSLHAGVCRLVTEVHSRDFDPRTDPRAIPSFLVDDDTTAAVDVPAETTGVTGRDVTPTLPGTGAADPTFDDFSATGPDSYDPEPLTEAWNHPVLESEFTAWKTLLAPGQHDDSYLTYLFVRGLEHYRRDTREVRQQLFIDHVQEFAIRSSKGVSPSKSSRIRGYQPNDRASSHSSTPRQRLR